uniref:MD-2-related lipid-recognition domain-containing protein n=1 Tax=Panagrolaimus superbus TaxID=310955 RepID=A0A914YBV3_9BILA
MFRSFIFVLIFIGVSYCCEKFPNGTETTLNWFASCPSKATIYTVTTSDANGNPEYPIHLGKPLPVHVNLTNNGDVYQQLKLNINIWTWGGWSGCSWHTLPTLGMLNNLDACSYGVPCPVPKGNQAMTLTIDFSKFQNIIDLLQDDSPYQVQMVMTADNGDQVCATVQARCRIH